MTVVVARPLPECRRCQAPMRRRSWHEAGGVCSSCITITEALQRVHTRARLEAVRTIAEKRAQERIERLAVKRASRAGRGLPL